MKYARLIAVAMLMLTLSAQQPSYAEPSLDDTYAIYMPLAITAPPGGQTPDQQQKALQVLALVNAERTTAGCAPLAMNDRLINAAQGQSQDMAELDFFGHSNPNASRATVGQRATAAGYDWSRIAENIAAGHSTAAVVMEQWMESTGHRANILNCAYTEIGIGYYFQPNDQILPSNIGPFYHYWTQVFATP